jgi:hypothetical protein
MERKIIIIDTPETFLTLLNYFSPLVGSGFDCSGPVLLLKSLINHTGYTALVRNIGTSIFTKTKFINHTEFKALKSKMIYPDLYL